MGEAEEVQEKMKADMEAMKEQMATMMEAMMSMKKIMEANAVAVAATSVVAKVNPMPSSGLNQMNHPTSDCRSKAPWWIKGVLMITKDDDKGDDKKLKDQSKNNSSESRTIQEFKIRIKKNSRLKKKV